MSFRQFGGLQFASKHNAVASHYNTSSNLIVTQNVGQPNSYINFLSDISGNQIFGNVDVSGNLDISGNLNVSGYVNATTRYGDIAQAAQSFIAFQDSGNFYGMGTIYGALCFSANRPFNSITPTPQMVLDMNGNVGIGTTSPQYELDVSGNTNVSGISYFITKQFSSSNPTPPEICSNAPIQIQSGYDFHDKLILTSDPSNNSAGIIQYIWDTDPAGQFLYKQLQLNPYGGCVFINKLSPNYNIDSYALDVSGNGSFNNSIYLYDLSSNDLFNSSISQYGSALNIKNNNGGGYIYINPLNATGITVFQNGYVGIGTALETIYALNVNGSVNATSYNTPSDYRIKENVTQLDSKFVVDNLNPVTYLNTKTDKQDIGLIAHELQEIYPELVNGEKDGEQFQSVNYIGLIPILIKEIQELKKEIKSVKIELNELKNK